MPASRAPLAAIVAAVALGGSAAPGLAATYAPPGERVFAGLTGGNTVDEFTRLVGKRPPVVEHWTTWGNDPSYKFRRWKEDRVRGMLHISTAAGGCTIGPTGSCAYTTSGGVISPRGIAVGRGDAYLRRLNRQAAASDRIIYVRLMAEMNGPWNPYSAFLADGRSRGRSYSTAYFRLAWKRVVSIVRGGRVARINRRLRALGLPRMHARRRELPRPKVSFVWAPMWRGTPNIEENRPEAYWPGGHYVDWVGTQIYSKYPTFQGMTSLYDKFDRKPFLIGEWAVRERDDPDFVRTLFAWVQAHPRTRMLMYYEGFNPDGPFRIARYPQSLEAVRAELAEPRYPAYAPEHRPSRTGG